MSDFTKLKNYLRRLFKHWNLLVNFQKYQPALKLVKKGNREKSSATLLLIIHARCYFVEFVVLSKSFVRECWSGISLTRVLFPIRLTVVPQPSSFYEGRVPNKWCFRAPSPSRRLTKPSRLFDWSRPLSRIVRPFKGRWSSAGIYLDSQKSYDRSLAPLTIIF